MSALTKLSQKRSVYINRITETYSVAQKAKQDSNQKSLFKVRFENLEEYYDEFKLLHNDIISIVEEKDFASEDVIRHDIDGFYFSTKQIFFELFPNNGQDQSVSVPQMNQFENIKMPKINCPNFDGDLQKWPLFYDMYLAVVQNNSQILKVQKFQYLLSLLKGEPLNLIKNIQITELNYDIAFKTLTDRYQNKRNLATTYWNSLIHSPHLKTNSSKDLRNLLDVFIENVAALNVLGFPTDQWCFVLFNMLLQRIDSVTKTAFEMAHSNIEIPTYQQLITFLNSHCRALEAVHMSIYQSIQTSKKPQKSQSPNSSFNSYRSQSSINPNSKPYQTQSYIANIPSTQNPTSSTQNSSLKNYDNSSQYRLHAPTNSTSSKCRQCHQSFHPLSQCSLFLSKTPSERLACAKQDNACINCLRFSHMLKDCPSTFRCRKCHHRHHTLLHISKNTPEPSTSHASPFTSNDKPQGQFTSPLDPDGSQNKFVPFSSATNHSTPSMNFASVTLSSTTSRSTVLLSTAKVDCLDIRGHFQTIRVLLDSGSQANFISQTCLNRLGLSRQQSSIPILGINQSSSITKGVTNCTIKPTSLDFPLFTFDALVLPKLCADIPYVQIDPQGWNHISKLKLGDEEFHIPSSIDMLLGADIYAQILKPGRILGETGQPTALETVFGWVLLGSTQTQLLSTTLASSSIESYFSSVHSSLEQSLRRFWELESLPARAFLSPDEQRCEDIYKSTLSRDKSGRFTVALPFKHSEPDLGDTYSIANKCFHSLESRLLKNPSLYAQYSDFMREYINNGHMSLIPKDEPKPKFSNYLPHHCVVKPEKSTTKVRVVFNASSKGSHGVSLNECLLPGPKLQTDINTILLRFRFHPIVFLADIKQMYLQILISPNHRNYQRLLWRFDPQEPLQEYRLNTVTFGVSSSPFLAIRTIQELARSEGQQYPDAAKVLLNDIFVDDICAGAPSLEAAFSLQKNLITLLNSGCFKLRKWASNYPELLSPFSTEDCQTPISFDKDDLPSIKVLGLQWDPKSDTLFFSCQPSNKPCTKRNILSEIARIFDPLGFLSPVSFFAKYIMQKLWTTGTGWDDPPEKSIIDMWTQFKEQLPYLSQIVLARPIFSPNLLRCELHGFSDASERGYASAVYLRLELPNQNINTSLIIAKSRVAPLKSQSLPRLELLGANLLANLLCFTIQTYSQLISIDEVFAYSDSQVVLHWIAGSPHRWKSFVANRVSHIQEVLPTVRWQHIASHENPVDCASRGITPADLVHHPLWFTGPPWLVSSRSCWQPSQSNSVNPDNFSKILQQEEKLLGFITTVAENPFDILVQNISSLAKIQRIVVYCLRFIHNSRNKTSQLSGASSLFEMQSALIVLVKGCQKIHFSEIISQLINHELLPKPFRKLALFLDPDGLVRVGGRLRHSDVPFAAKHPLLLPRSARLTTLLIEQIHKENFHPGHNSVLYLLRQQFWILSARRAIQTVLSHCLRCFRLKPISYVPYMGDLPSFRISQLKCFSHCTLDNAGPFFISMGKQRGAKITKAYLCIFVCCATKAVHLELVSDLSSDVFIAAFRRFIARRGRCTHLYSDCGSNFIGANNQLQEMSKVASEHLNIMWHFNPPSAPHFNGLSEAGVKSVKSHLYRVIGEQKLTYEELNTLLVQIEALLNSRPLYAQSSDPNDLSPLTPGHFLTLEPLNSCPDPDLSNLKLNTLSRWQLIQRLNSDFWKRWKAEYLNTLQQRSKWTNPDTKVELGTLVVIKNESQPPLRWALGRIVELHPGHDGKIRVVTLKTAQGLIKRPIVKLCPLPTAA